MLRGERNMKTLGIQQQRERIKPEKGEGRDGMYDRMSEEVDFDI